MVTESVNVTAKIMDDQDNHTTMTTMTSVEISTENVTYPTSSITTELLTTEVTTIQEVETTTEESTTVAGPKTCVDMEHECCPDGVTPAQVN